MIRGKESKSDQASHCQSLGRLYSQSIEQLKLALHTQPQFVKVHAAESLLEIDYSAEVLAVFNDELRQFGSQPLYRVGIWRVLARASTTEATRSEYVKLLCHSYLDPQSPDSAAAVESLSKLQYRVSAAHHTKFEQAADRLSPVSLPYARWLLAISGTERDLFVLSESLDAHEPFVRGVTAYALRHLRDQLPQSIITRVATVAREEPDGLGRAYLLSAAYITASDAGQLRYFKNQLMPFLQSGNKDQKYELVSALGIRGNRDDLTKMAELLEDPEPDVRVAAATAVLRTERY